MDPARDRARAKPFTDTLGGRYIAVNSTLVRAIGAEEARLVSAIDLVCHWNNVEYVDEKGRPKQSGSSGRERERRLLQQFHNGHWWATKKAEEWMDFLGITSRATFMRLVAKCKKLEVIQCVRLTSGTTVSYRIVEPNISKRYIENVSFRDVKCIKMRHSRDHTTNLKFPLNSPQSAPRQDGGVSPSASGIRFGNDDAPTQPEPIANISITEIPSNVKVPITEMELWPLKTVFDRLHYEARPSRPTRPFINDTQANKLAEKRDDCADFAEFVKHLRQYFGCSHKWAVENNYDVDTFLRFPIDRWYGKPATNFNGSGKSENALPRYFNAYVPPPIPASGKINPDIQKLVDKRKAGSTARSDPPKQMDHAVEPVIDDDQLTADDRAALDALRMPAEECQSAAA